MSQTPCPANSPRPFEITYRWLATGDERTMLRECASALECFMLFVLTIAQALGPNDEMPLEILEVREATE